MNRILLLLAIGGITFLVILFALRPDLWEDFLLWIVGLAGVIVRLITTVFSKLKNLFSEKPFEQTDKEAAHESHRTKTIDESVG